MMKWSEKKVLELLHAMVSEFINLTPPEFERVVQLILAGNAQISHGDDGIVRLYVMAPIEVARIEGPRGKAEVKTFDLRKQGPRPVQEAASG